MPKAPRVPPTLVAPHQGAPAEDTWQNMVLLMDKPKGWTSFDVVGKIGPARYRPPRHRHAFCTLVS